jgi:hypothetical protein
MIFWVRIINGVFGDWEGLWQQRQREGGIFFNPKYKAEDAKRRVLFHSVTRGKPGQNIASEEHLDFVEFRR